MSGLEKRITCLRQEVEKTPLSAFYPSDVEVLIALFKPNWKYRIFEFQDIEVLEERVKAYREKQGKLNTLLREVDALQAMHTKY